MGFASSYVDNLDAKYDDVMQDAKAAHVVRMLFRFDEKFKNRVLEYIKFVSESLIPKGL